MIQTAEQSKFQQDKAKLPWLAMLLDAYKVSDKGIDIAIKEQEKKRKIKLACKKGCNNCCRNLKDIPVYPLELVGIYWFVIERTSRPLRGVLKKQLLEYRKGGPCPFLVDGACSIHPFRPMACRQFNVFGNPCAEGEDPYYTRRGDVLTPIQKYTDQAIALMLPFYGITDEAAKAKAIKNRLIHTQARVLQACDWPELARRMDDFDFGNRPTEG